MKRTNNLNICIEKGFIGGEVKLKEDYKNNDKSIN